jgi:transposase-like protein
MPVRLCPTCGRPTVRGRTTPIDAEYYYRCAYCRHLWSTPIADPDAAPTTLMPGRPPAADAAIPAPPPPLPCPRCANVLQYLATASHFEREHWYRCLVCGRVFTVAKDRPLTKPVLISLED